MEDLYDILNAPISFDSLAYITYKCMATVRLTITPSQIEPCSDKLYSLA